MHVNSNDVSLIMMAAGESARFCSNFPCKKQWIRVGDDPLWLVATRKVASYTTFKNILITASSTDYIYMKDISPYKVVKGGKTRMQSLCNALEYVDTTFVLVSDVARWNSVECVVDSIFEAMEADVDCVAPYLEVADTSFYENAYLKRESLKLIQTPQLSRVAVLKEALNNNDRDFSDESSAIYAFGKKVVFVRGSNLMSKLTLDSDLLFHCAYLRPPCKKTFVGLGIDIHEFEHSKPMWLGGVNIESDFGFKAHSDGDVVLHALCDAILGAIGGGDIGQWFPDTDDMYKGADSKTLLENVYNFARSVGYELYNADISIMAQIPKITPYKMAMRECIARILNVEISLISIKATTTEGLGFIGRKEGVCAQAQVSMGFMDWQQFLHKGGLYENFNY